MGDTQLPPLVRIYRCGVIPTVSALLAAVTRVVISWLCIYVHYFKENVNREIGQEGKQRGRGVSSAEGFEIASATRGWAAR